MSYRSLNLDAPYQTIRGTSIITGLAPGYIRKGCRDGSIPHLRIGKEYRVNVPLFLERLETAAAESLDGGE